MTKADLIALAERVERADAARQAELIGDAWDMLGPIRHWTAWQAARFAKMLDAEAYESAAMTLVSPPGKWSITAGHADDWQAAIWFEDGRALDWRSASTPSLALTAASLRAIAEGVGE